MKSGIKENSELEFQLKAKPKKSFQVSMVLLFFENSWTNKI